MNTDWKPGRIGDFYRPTRKPREVTYADRQSIPFVPMDLVPLGGNNQLSWIEKSADEITSGTYFERGDVLVARITPSFENGKQAVADDLPAAFGVGSTELIPLQEIENVSDRWFLFYLLIDDPVRRRLADKMEGSTGRQRLPDNVLLDCPISLPPLPEQRRIAAVLGKLQRAVELEAAQERATRELKQSVMRRLFTRGLRGERLRDTPLGPLPDSWQTPPAAKIFKLGSGKTRPPLLAGTATAANPYPVVGGNGTMGYSAEWFIERDVSVVIGRVGEYCGATHLVRGRAWITDNALYDTEWLDSEVSKEFLGAFLQFFRLNRFKRLGGQPLITQGQIYDLSFPKPPLGEQREIAAILAAIDRKIALHAARRRARQELFRSVLHALMTARLRVPPSLNHFAGVGKMVSVPRRKS